MLNKNRDNLIKEEISLNIHVKYGISKNYANKFIDTLINILIENLKENKMVRIKNFGSFRVKSKTERIGRNPKNKRTYIIDKRNVISFKPSISFKNMINNG
tara:strand:- start:739 stop:1041 length:303 start_codon:yes stop_codon:yes gene_type:complete